MSFERFGAFHPKNRTDARLVQTQASEVESAEAARSERRSGSVKGWVVPAAVVVAIEYLFALVIGASVGFHYRIPFEAYAITGACIALLGITVFIAFKFATCAMQGEPRPARRLLAEFPRCYGFVLGTVLVAVQMAVLTWTKIMLPLATPFWADPLLADVDHAIFRADPWRIVEALFGWAAPMVDAAYVTWVLVKFVTLAAVLAAPESRRKAQVLISYFLIMACTALGQYLLSSGGPVFYARLGFGDRFDALPIEPWVKVTTSYLWSDYARAGGEIGTGISAMPSLHVAIALWFALVMRAYLPRAAVLGHVYFALILIGSVLLGWHYAADGIAAIAITLISWRAARSVPIAGPGPLLRARAAV
jgi:PAP2 superfamily